jgi:hypothetical protein
MITSPIPSAFVAGSNSHQTTFVRSASLQSLPDDNLCNFLTVDSSLFDFEAVTPPDAPPRGLGRRRRERGPSRQPARGTGACMGLIYDISIQEMIEQNEAAVFIEWRMFPLGELIYPTGSPVNALQELKTTSLAIIKVSMADGVPGRNIVLCCGYFCSTCAYEHRGGEEWYAKGLLVARCNGGLLEWEEIEDAGYTYVPYNTPA